MPAFVFRAVDRLGRRHRGTEEAATPADLAKILERRGLLVLALSSAKPSGRWSFGQRSDVLEATRALSTLLRAGLPLARALEVTAELTRRALKGALLEARARVQRGDPLHTALADHPRLFPPVYVGVVRAGERSGKLAEAFRRMESQLERELALRSKLLNASIYPAILGVVGGVAVVLLTLFVLPRFAELLADAGAQLPSSTKLFLAASNTAIAIWPAFVLAPPLSVLLVVTWLRTEPGRMVAARTLLGAPGLRALRRQALAARFARLTGVLMAGGVPLLDALKDAGESAGDPVARDETTRIRLRVREGAALNQALAEGRVFPALLQRLVAVGEESGRLEEFLTKAADLFEVRVAQSTERLATLAEPAMILFFGGLVGWVALAMLQAVYGVNAGAFR